MRFRRASPRAGGAALVFGRLWQRQGLPGILERLSAHPKFGFDVERVVFALELQRLAAPGSDWQGAGWLETTEAPGFETIRLHQMYRAVAALAEMREDLERELFLVDRDLFSGGPDLVCIDTTSTYVYREHEHEGTLRRRGYSLDKRPDLLQVVVCLAVDRRGWPVAWEIFPGNTADRPIYHQNDGTCIGHLVASFLALRLEVDLHSRLDAAAVTIPWPDPIRDLAQVQAVIVDLDGKRYPLRTDLRGTAHAAFAAAGVRPPSSVTNLEPFPSTGSPKP